MDENYDPQTGEIIEEVDPGKTVYIPGTKVQANVTNLARLPLTGLEFRVLFALLAQVKQGDGHVAKVTVQEVAEALDKKHQGIQRIFDSLREKGILGRERNGIWVINPRLAYRGNYYQWARTYITGPEPAYVTNSNGLDGKRKPIDYNRTQQIWAKNN